MGIRMPPAASRAQQIRGRRMGRGTHSCAPSCRGMPPAMGAHISCIAAPHLTATAHTASTIANGACTTTHRCCQQLAPKRRQHLQIHRDLAKPNGTDTPNGYRCWAPTMAGAGIVPNHVTDATPDDNKPNRKLHTNRRRLPAEKQTAKTPPHLIQHYRANGSWTHRGSIHG